MGDFAKLAAKLGRGGVRGGRTWRTRIGCSAWWESFGSGHGLRSNGPSGSGRRCGSPLVDALIALLDYELATRKELDPVDAQGVVARMERLILKHLGNGPAGHTLKVEDLPPHDQAVRSKTPHEVVAERYPIPGGRPQRPTL